MNTSKKLCAATVLMSCIGGVMANDSATLQVTGTLEPSSCKVSFEGGGVISFGAITITDDLEPKKLKTLKILCPAPTQIKLAFIDNTTTLTSIGHPSFYKAFGLDITSKDRESWYRLFPYGATVNGKSAEVIMDHGSGWAFIGGHIVPGTTLSFSGPGVIKPLAIENASLKIEVGLTISSAAFKGLTKELPFEGSTTVELYIL